MKICLAQTQSVKGDIQKNIQNHLKYITRAVKLEADFIFFPELSITNYEPTLAKELATTIDNPIFKSFQEKADNHKITICVGMPTLSSNGIKISILIFHPKLAPSIYSKQMLHEDELPYFICSNTQTFLTIKGTKMALGICYETLQEAHFVNAIKNGATVYIASVAKPKSGIYKAYKHFPIMAAKFNTSVVMANCIGNCDNFTSVGQSAIWNVKGEIISRLDATNQGIIVYDTKKQLIEKEQLTIKKANLTDLDTLCLIYKAAKEALENNHIYQWTNNYPTRSIIENDIKNKFLYALKNKGKIIGAITLNEDQETNYKTINWQYNNTKVLVIHRLVVSPNFQGKGYANILMDFAEKNAQEYNYTSIRLDAFSLNKNVLELYKKRNYIIRGEIYFPERTDAFFAMEKEI